MIPRKRLQVLLYILQIFYVFGDGDPGRESLLINDVRENAIDEPAFANKPTYVPPLTQDEIVSTDKEMISNDSQEGYDLNYRPEGDQSLNSQENLDALEDHTDVDFLNRNETEAVIDNVRVVDKQATSLNVSWECLGDNGTYTYYLGIYQSENLIESYNTTDQYYLIKDLEPCTKYKVGVSLFPILENNTDIKNVTEETNFSKPGPPTNFEIIMKPVSLDISWKSPTASACVKNYRVTINSKTSEDRDYRTENTLYTNYTFNDLIACAAYNVQVTPVDRENEDAKTFQKQSDQSSPRVTLPPWLNESNTMSIETTKNSTDLTWHILDKRNNCSLISVVSECTFNQTEGFGFQLFNGSSVVNITKGQKPENVSLTIHNLSPFTHYICRARIENEAGSSNWSSPIKILTMEDVPSIPQNFQKLGSELYFVWEKPKYLPGKLRNYKIIFTWEPSHPVPDVCDTDRTIVVDNIDPQLTDYTLTNYEFNSHYIAKISARTGAGYSYEAPIEFDSGGSGVPDKVTNLTVTIAPQETNPNLLDTILSWGLPCSSKGYLRRFEVSFYGKNSKHMEDNMTEITVNVTNDVRNNDIFRVNFGELKPLYNYTFEVFASVYGSVDDGEIASISVIYPPGIPPQPTKEYIESITLDPQKARKTTSTAAILLPVFPEENGDVKYYAVMVSGVPFKDPPSMRRFDVTGNNWPNESTWKEAMESDFAIPYQATYNHWNPDPNFIVNYGQMQAVKFVIGEDTNCPSISTNAKYRVHCNGPLKPDTLYEVRMRAFTEQGYRDSVTLIIKTNAELNVVLVLSVVFGILTIGILTTLMLLVKRCSFRLIVQRILQSPIPESPVPDAFTRRKFLNHCQQLAENPGKLSNEFQLLQTLSIDLQMPSNTACLQANRKKNRYSDILPYDFSRVKLEVIDDDPNTDYINASFIRGYSGNEEYIACQGPKEETTYDFWRMVDQYDVKLILMLTQLVENGKEKCHQYFPTIRETFNYENLSIKCTSELDYRTYTQRTLILQKDGSKRTITHLHFKDWPDHDVPDDFDAMIHFCQIFRKQFASVKGLAVVHCSAGIGRTGTLIAIDILLQCVRDSRKLDVFGTVYRLRRHRLNMVQRESQYAYIYNCMRQVLKNPYFLKTYKPPPIEPIYNKNKTNKERSDSNTNLVDSLNTLRKTSLSTSIDSLRPLCESSPHTAPKIQMNGLRYCKSTSAIDTKSNPKRIGKYNSVGYAICERDSFSSTSKESMDENDFRGSSGTVYENIEPLIRPDSSQTIAEDNCYLTNDFAEKDTSL